MIAFVIKSGSRSIQFLQEELVKNFDVIRVMQCQLSPQGEPDVKWHCDGANHIKRQKAFENTRSLSIVGFTKATDRLHEQLCCRGSDYSLGKCMQRSVKHLKFQRTLWS